MQYLEPLVRWHAGSVAGQRHAGRDFVLVSGFDLGRADFPRAAAQLRDWTVLSLNGDGTWLRAKEMGQPRSQRPPGACEELGQWRHALGGNDWRVQEVSGEGTWGVNVRVQECSNIVEHTSALRHAQVQLHAR
mmetsp:Transcript_63393/g.205836  ORF Transcript_63393/g.205836 Transcript_63393/m.205836 type:complete len:133 (+) Transcript_63393:217-615(+)